MRIGTFKVQRNKIEELLDLYQNEAIPIIKKAGGNVNAFILQKEDDKNHFMACTIWRTKEDADNYERSGQALEIVSKVRHTFDGPPSLSTYESFGI